MSVLTIGDLHAGSQFDISVSDNVHHMTQEPMLVAQVYDADNDMKAAVWFTFEEALALARFINATCFPPAQPAHSGPTPGAAGGAVDA